MPNGGDHSARRINKLIEAVPQWVRYLEIGVLFGTTIENVRAPERWGVDPQPQFDINHLPRGVIIVPKTSDEFFGDLAPEQQFDLVFVDGLHTFRQAYRDVINGLQVCQNGLILLDDVVPCDQASAIPDYVEAMTEARRLSLERPPEVWHGDVFRVLHCIVRYHPELSFRTIVGPDNPQAVIWRNMPGCAVVGATSEALDEVGRISFEATFGDGIPEIFFPASEDRALGDALAAVRGCAE